MFSFVLGGVVAIAIAAYVEVKNVEADPAATSKLAALAKKFTDMF